MRKKLSGICKFYSGTGFPLKYQGKTHGKLPFYKVGDITNNVMQGNTNLKLCNNYISDVEAEEIGGTIIPPNTVVFAKIGEALRLNRRAITTVKCLIDNNVMGIAPIESEVSLKYLYYFMCNLKMELLAESTTVPSVRKSKLEELEIDLPDLQEQHNIEKILDGVSALIQLRKIQLEQYEKLIKSRFVEMFGDITLNPFKWKKECLQSHIDMITGYPFDSNKYSIEGIKICGGLIIMPNCIKWEECKYWESGDGYEQFFLDADDIVLALDRPWISEGLKIGMVHSSDLPALLIQRTARIRGKDMEQKFLLYLLKDEAFKRQCTVTGSLVPHISNKDINNYEVIVPPLELQRRFATFVGQVEKLKVTAKKSLRETQKFFDSLVQSYFG